MRRPASTMARIARATRKPARVEISTMDTVQTSVPPPPLPAMSGFGSGSDTTPPRRLWWALPLLTLAALILVSVLVAAILPLQRWQQSPGSALEVADRLEITGAERFPTGGEILFVTATGSQMTLLGSLMGAIDDDVDVLTYEQRFGPRTPTETRRIGFQAMFGSKQVAEYVAARLLGLEAAFVPGPAVVADVICGEQPQPGGACEVLEVGDVIEAIDGEATATLPDVPRILDARSPGDTVTVTVTPFGAERSVERSVVLRAAEDDPARAIVGFLPADTRRVELPFDVDIDTSRIGGPSAGLAFTLALIDELSPGSLTGGVEVAATGTIAETGAVGAIGALRQKAVAVRDAGAEVFLVPASQDPAELAEIRAALGESLQLIEVATIGDALEVLAALGGDLGPLDLDGLAPSTVD